MARIGWMAWIAVWALRIPAAEAGSVIRLEARQNGRLLAPVGVNGKQVYRFLVDTGATSTVIDTRLSRRLGVNLPGKERVRTFAGEVEFSVGRVETLAVGHHSIVGAVVLSADLRHVFGLEPEIEGILGQDVLSRFNYLLDRRSRKLEIQDGDEQAASISGTPVPFKKYKGMINIAAAGGSLQLLLDSGIPYPVLYEEVVPKLDLTFVGSGEETSARSGIGDRRLRPARLAVLEVGDARLRNLQVFITARRPGQTGDGILPVHLFEAIYVNNLAGFVIMNPVRAR